MYPSNKTAYNTQDFNVQDPWPNLPTKLTIRAKTINDGKEILIFLPEEFIDCRVSIKGDRHGWLEIHSGSLGLPVTRGFDEERGGSIGRLVLDAATVIKTPMARDRKSHWNCDRNGADIGIGVLLTALREDYVPPEKREINAWTAPPTPVVLNTIKIEDEMKMFKKALESVNAAAKKNGLCLFIKEDGLLGAKIEF